MLRKAAVVTVISTFVTLEAHAQERDKNEVGLLLGGAATPMLTISGPSREGIEFGAGLTFQATYARHLTDGSSMQLSLEIPLLAAPAVVATSKNSNVPLQYASLFITPGLRVRFVPGAVVSPWVSIGGGYARFDEAAERVNGTPNPGPIGTDAGAAQFGGGVNIRTPVRVLFPISLRVERR